LKKFLLFMLATSVLLLAVTRLNPSLIPASLGQPETAIQASLDPQLKWEFTTLATFPAVVMDDEQAAVGVISGDFYTKDKSDFWVFYSQRTPDPFLLVSIAVDGKIIALCEKDGVVCDYWPSESGGSSVLALTVDQLKALQSGKVLDLVFFKDDKFIGVQRSLVGFNEQVPSLLASYVAPPKEEKPVAPWELIETKQPTTGHVVLVWGPVEEGEITLSWSSVGYFKQVVPVDNYSGAEVFFKPISGEIVHLETVYWDYKGRRTNIAIADLCKQQNKTFCVFRGGVSVVMTEQDLLMMQIDRTLVVEWSDKDSKIHTSKVLLGQRSYPFNNRIQQLMKTKAQGMHPSPRASI